jgi:hypothetical protein
MTPQILAITIPIFLGLGLFTMIVFLRRYQYLERMQMLERGINPKDVQRMVNRRYDPYRHIRWAATLIGVGSGLFIGNVVFDGFHNEGIIFGLVFLLGGIGLFAGSIIQYRLQKKDTPSDEVFDSEDI